MIEETVQPFDRTAVLARTPEEIAEDKEAQESAKERLRPLVTDSIAVAQHKNAIGVMNGMIRSGKIDFERLAEAQFWKGEFYEAFLTLGLILPVNHTKRAEYKAYFKAMETIGTICRCAPIQIRIPGSAKGESVPARREIQRVYVAEIHQEVAFIKCERCKELFAQTV